MKNNVVRLNEAQLQQIIKESVTEVLRTQYNLNESDINEGLWDYMKGFGKSFGNKAQTAGNMAGNAMRQGAQNAANAAAGAYNKAAGAVGNAYNKAADAVKSGANAVGNAASNAYNKAAGAVQNGAQAVGKQFGDMTQAGRNASAIGDLKSIQSKMQKYQQLFMQNPAAKRGYSMMTSGLNQIIQAVEGGQMNY